MNAPFQPSPQSHRIEYPPKTLAELRAIEPNAAPWAHLEFTFFVSLFQASDARRMKAGPKGLLDDAARSWLKLAMRQIAKARWEHGILLLWDMSMIEHLVAELASDMADSAKLKTETIDAVKTLRDLVFENGYLLKGDANLTTNWRDEDATRILTRTLDYIEHIEEQPSYTSMIDLRRFCCSCLRVINAVFGTVY